MVTPPPVTNAGSAADRVKTNSSNFPQAPARREVIPRTKGVNETVSENRKKKIEQRKNATITEENEEDENEGFEDEWL